MSDTELTIQKRCPCDTSNPRSSWPSSIMKDGSVCKLKEFVFKDPTTVDNHFNAVMKQIVYHTSMFNYVESIFNSNNEYYYGEIPYIIQTKLSEFIGNKRSINTNEFKSYIEQQIILQYLNKTYNLDYTNPDFNKIQVLIVFVLMKMSKNNQPDLFHKFMKCYIKLTLYYNINFLYGNDLYTVDVNPSNNEFTAAKIQDILAAIINSFSTSKCQKKKQGIEVFKQCIQDMLVALQDNSDFNTVMSYIGWTGETFDIDQLEQHNQSLLIPLQSQFDSLYNECIDQYCTSFKRNETIYYNTVLSDISQKNVDKTATLIGQSSTIYQNLLYTNLLENYYYTSLIMYRHHNLPPIKSNDDGNGRLSEYLMSNVYYNYAVYIYTHGNINSDILTFDMYDEYNNIYNNNSTYFMLNIRKLCSLYNKYFCPNTVFTKRFLNRENPTCNIVFNQGYNIYADVYNKINIDRDYVIVETNDIEHINKIFRVLDGRDIVEDPIDILRDIITLLKQFVIIFAPLRPLANYYSTMESNNSGRGWFIKNLNIYSDTIDINNDSGGDLYCTYKDDFYIFDSKRYDNFDTCYKVKTFIQSWMYMNVYWKPLCCIYNNAIDQNYNLYKNYYLGFINPLHNDMSACSYDSITAYINNKDNTYYRDDSCNCKYDVYMKNNYKLVTPKTNDTLLSNIEDIQWSIETYNTRRIMKQINLYGCNSRDQLKLLYCSNPKSALCKRYKELINQKCGDKPVVKRRFTVPEKKSIKRTPSPIKISSKHSSTISDPVKQVDHPINEISQHILRNMPTRTRHNVVEEHIDSAEYYPENDIYTEEDIEREIENRPCKNANKCRKVVDELYDMFCYGTPNSCNKFHAVMKTHCDKHSDKLCEAYKQFMNRRKNNSK